jgi:hypothetical protein
MTVTRWNDSLFDRFADKFTVGEGCWTWHGARNRGGYGQLDYKGRRLVASRISWALFNGPIPKDMVVCHRCDNPRCVRPDHLFLGTRADNNADRDVKGRHVALSGEQNGFSRLTEQSVAVIRRGGPALPLARRFGVSVRQIYKIRSGKAWAD